MKRIAVVILFVVLVFISTAEAAGKTKSLMVNDKRAKVRSGPATAYSILWKPRIYTPFEILAEYKDENSRLWYIVRDVEGDIGWIYNATVIKKPGAIVVVKMVDIREKGSSKAKVVYRAPKNYTFKVLQESKGWYKVEDPDGDKGWVRKKDVWTGATPHSKKRSQKP
jgi:SH3-like domain-containing protein